MATIGLDSKLPNEILTKIAQCCSTNGRLNLCRSSQVRRHVSLLLNDNQDGMLTPYPAQLLNRITTRVIYRNVDLSIHNQADFMAPYWQAYPQSPGSFFCLDVPPNALERQELFLGTMVQHPEYANLVFSLTWTLLLLHTKGLNQILLGIRPNRSILKIWDVFQALTNVKTLDIAYLSNDHTHPLASQFPDILFPAATTIRLSGVMHYSLAASILAARPDKLIHLTFDNLNKKATFEQTAPHFAK